MAGLLDGKVILIAGGGGIATGLAHRYFAEGATIAIGDRNAGGVEALVRELDPTGMRAAAFAFEGGEEESIGAFVAAVVARFGRLNGVHANFADFSDGKRPEGVVDLPIEIYDRIMHVNARGFVLLTREVVPALIAAGGGSIVYMSSGAAYNGEAIRYAYAMSKSAIHALTRHVASRYGPDGIRANAIAPGIIMHPTLEASMKEETKAWARSRVASRSRLGHPGDIAAMGAHLLSDESGFLTGQVISIDGGSTMRA